jgi:hypothetical protein
MENAGRLTRVSRCIARLSSCYFICGLSPIVFAIVFDDKPQFIHELVIFCRMCEARTASVRENNAVHDVHRILRANEKCRE